MKQHITALVMILLFAANGGDSRAQDLEIQPDYIVHVREDIINRSIIGMGWNTEEARYLSQDGLSSIERTIGKTLTDEEWDRYFDLMAWSGCEIIRHGFWVQIPSEGRGDTLYEPQNDNDDPYTVNPEGFDFDGSHFDLHYRFLQAYKDRDIEVLFTHWKNLAPWNAIAEIPHEVAEQHNISEETWQHYKNQWDDILEQALPLDFDEYAEGAVYLLKHLLLQKGFSNITYFSMWNEPNFIGDLGYTYPDEWWPLVESFHNQMTHQGIIEAVKFVAPDSSGGEESIPLQVAAYGGYIDIIADHDYYSQANVISSSPRLRDYSRVLDGVREYYGSELPFIVTEYGACGDGANMETGPDMTYKASLSQARIIIEHFKRGVKGFLRWAYHISDGIPCYNALVTSEEFWYAPNGATYYPHAVFARYVKPGMHVFASDISAEGRDKDGYENVGIAVLADTDNEGLPDITILLVNEGEFAQKVRLNFDTSGLPSSFNTLYVNGPESGILDGGVLETRYDSNGSPYLTLDLNPMTIMTLTTIAPGDLEAPQALSLCRAEEDSSWDAPVILSPKRTSEPYGSGVPDDEENRLNTFSMAHDKSSDPVTPVPEPSTFILLLAGLVGLLGMIVKYGDR